MVSAVPSAMKRFLLLCSLMTVLAWLGGCVFMNDEDRDFYGRGWVKPAELDQPIPHHSGPPTADATASAPLPSTTSDPAHDSAWDVPGDHPR